MDRIGCGGVFDREGDLVFGGYFVDGVELFVIGVSTKYKPVCVWKR